LGEFRIPKDLFENQIKEANESLKRKDQELPVHLERMERQTVLRIETLFVLKKFFKSLIQRLIFGMQNEGGITRRCHRRNRQGNGEESHD
jgi:hypothetical protein